MMNFEESFVESIQQELKERQEENARLQEEIEVVRVSFWETNLLVAM